MKSLATALLAALIVGTACTHQPQSTPPATTKPVFQRLATFPVFQNSSVDLETAAEIITVSSDGMTLIYANSIAESLGFIDISEPRDPQPGGAVELPGEPTSIGVIGEFALTCVNTSANYIEASGELVVVHVTNQEIATSIDLGGQPDSISISPDKRFAVIAIENERDESFDHGRMPQAPGGYAVIVDCTGAPAAWTTQRVALDGLGMLYPGDAEPEYVDINTDNIAVMTMQENNHVVLIDVEAAAVIDDFSCGTVDLTEIDSLHNGLIEQSATLSSVLREPDAVVWINTATFATANEGDMDGGSRGFTIWDTEGSVLFDAASTSEHLAARHGHYPESRAGAKGVESESVDFGRFGDERLLFVGSERASMVLVYELPGDSVEGAKAPVFRQLLPCGVGPESLLAIPSRDLLVVASERDARNAGYRSCVSIYGRSGQVNYPTLISADRNPEGVPIPWGALSGLSAGSSEQQLFAVHDDAYRHSRIFTIEGTGTLPTTPAVIMAETVIVDADHQLKAVLKLLKKGLPKSATADFRSSLLVEKSGRVNLDLEAVCALDDGTFWLASEGSGELHGGKSKAKHNPFKSPNLLLHVSQGGHILGVVLPPMELTLNQSRFGFEGLTFHDGALFVAFQRGWKAAGDPEGFTRIGRYDLVTKSWSFAHYPLDASTSPNGGWVGVSGLANLPGGRIAVLERDNQAGTDAAIKRIYSIAPEASAFIQLENAEPLTALSKQLEVDLIDAGSFERFGGATPAMIEGLAVTPGGRMLTINDNNATNKSTGETFLVEVQL